MANVYVSSGQWQAVAAWTASQLVSAGVLRRQSATPAAGSERVWVVTTAGTTGSTEPTWNLGKGSTTTDNGVVWTEVTGVEQYQAPGAWGAPHASIHAACATKTNGDAIFVDSAHSKQLALSVAITGSTSNIPCLLASVDLAGSVPPVPANLKAGAFEQSLTNNNLSIASAWADILGVNFTAGSGTSSATLIVQNAISTLSIVGGRLALGGTGGGTISLNTITAGSKITLDGTTVSFAAASQSIQISGPGEWRGLTAAAGSVVPSNLFTTQTQRALGFTVENSDLSFMGTNPWVNLNYGLPFMRFVRCKGAANFVPVTNINGAGSAPIDLFACDSGGAYTRTERYGYAGSQLVETAVVRTGGASDGVTPVSWRVVTNANTTLDQFDSHPIGIFVSAGARTVTMEGLSFGTALPTQDDVTIEARYLGTAGSTLGSRVTSGKATRLSTAANYAASTQAWDSLVAARGSSANYTTGAIIKTGSNSGRVFICTAGGQSAASEPAGYASAVDGSTITDGGAMFRAGYRFKMSVSFTVSVGAHITALARTARPSATFYLDPALTAA